MGTLAHPEIRESSGIVRSARTPNVFWTHNDSGNLARLYATTPAGAHVAYLDINAYNIDWEDIATPVAYPLIHTAPTNTAGANSEPAADITPALLYIADTGNNSRRRKVVQLIVIEEPPLAAPVAAAPNAPSTPIAAAPQAAANPTVVTLQPVTPVRTYQLRYPKQPFDCEALVILGSHAYFFSKDWSGKCDVYRIDLTGPDEQVFEFLCTLRMPGAVTAANLTSPPVAIQERESSQHLLLALLTVGGPVLIELPVPSAPNQPPDFSNLSNLPTRFLRYPRGSAEAITFSADASHVILTTEVREILAFPLAAFGAYSPPRPTSSTR